MRIEGMERDLEDRRANYGDFCIPKRIQGLYCSIQYDWLKDVVPVHVLKLVLWFG